MEIKAKDFVEALRCALAHAGKKDVRYYINSVAFDMQGDTLSLVGTDGHRGAFVEFKPRTLPAQGVWVATRASVEVLLKAMGSKPAGYVTLEIGAGEIRVDPIGLRLEMIAGKYPDWRRVMIPHGRPEPTTEVGFNADYLAESVKALGRLCHSKYRAVHMELRGQNSGIVLCAEICEADFPEIERAAAVIMPIRPVKKE